MSEDRLEITPSVTVHALLNAYPELEEVLIETAPPFKKLRNPVLRRSVAKVATIKQVSSVGNVPLNELIDTLRKAVGQRATTESYDDAEYFGEQPDWFLVDKIALSLDEDVADKDTMTLVTIIREAKDVKKGEIIELRTSFLPAPGIDKMRSKGYSCWTRREGEDEVRSYFLKNTD